MPTRIIREEPDTVITTSSDGGSAGLLIGVLFAILIIVAGLWFSGAFDGMSRAQPQNNTIVVPAPENNTIVVPVPAAPAPAPAASTPPSAQ